MGGFAIKNRSFLILIVVLLLNTILFTLPEKRGSKHSYKGLYNSVPIEKKVVKPDYKDRLDSLILTSGVKKSWYKRRVKGKQRSITLNLPSNNGLERYNRFVTSIIRKLGVDSYNVKELNENAVSIDFFSEDSVNIVIRLNRKSSDNFYLEPRMAIVIDDFGYQWRPEHVQGFLKFPVPVTLSIIPGHSFSKRIALRAQKYGVETIIHFPMEPKIVSIEKELVKLTDTTSVKTIKSMLDYSFADVPGAVGLNNHMGSKATEDLETMSSFFEVYKEYKTFFLDSYTTSNSVCTSLCEQFNIPSARRDIFVDNSYNSEDITKNFEDGIKEMEKGKDVIIIGHSRSETYKVLHNLVKFKYPHIKYVTLKEILN